MDYRSLQHNLTNQEAREASKIEIEQRLRETYADQHEALDEIDAFLSKMSALGVPIHMHAIFPSESSKLEGITAQGFGNGEVFLEWEKGKLTQNAKLKTIQRNHAFALSIGAWAHIFGEGSCIFEKGAHGFISMFHQACVWKDSGEKPEDYIKVENGEL